MSKKQIVSIMAAIIATKLINDDTFTRFSNVKDVSRKAIELALEIAADTEDLLTEPN